MSKPVSRVLCSKK